MKLRRNIKYKRNLVEVLQDAIETQKKNKDLQIWNKNNNFNCVKQKHNSNG
jgi:hypothetical protein